MKKIILLALEVIGVVFTYLSKKHAGSKKGSKQEDSDEAQD
jgi:hypothetical protein